MKSKFKIKKLSKTPYNRPKRILTHKLIRQIKMAGVVLGTLIAMLVVYKGERAGEWFKASVLEAPQPFNGTVLPIAKVPNWTTWKGDHYKTSYNDISPSDLIDFPPYDLAKLQVPNDNLVWGKKSDDDIRNEKITYSVVYLGNYELDHAENVGSHPAVDIKVPLDTPVHAISNGKVIKASTGSTGFGHHICIKHIDVPDPDNAGKLTTLYSCYCHMNRVDVSEGQNVLKGQIIGTSGNTGTSTVPHLHFQIDRDSAPWHPYWPFTSAESQAAGLSFFESINKALGIDKAKINTINPVRFVYGNLNNSVIVSSNTSTTAPNPTPSVEVVTNPLPTSESSSNKTDPNLLSFKLSGEAVSLIGNGISVLVEDTDNELSKLTDDQEIIAEISGVGQLQKKVFTKKDFNNKTLRLVVTSSEIGSSTITMGRSSHLVSFVEKAEGVTAFKISHDGRFQDGVAEKIKIMAIDQSGNLTPAPNFSGVVDITVTEGDADLNPSRLTLSDFKNGIAEVEIRPSTEGRLVFRAQQGALIGISESMSREEKSLFADINLGHKNYEAIKYLKDQSIISGYSDGTFQPQKTVNRVEALKMLMLAFNIQAGPAGSLPFADTDNSAWYASTLATALSKGIVKGYEDKTFKPANIVNRAELLKILFNTAGVEVNTTMEGKPYSDVELNAWYAPFAYLAKKKNIVEVSDDTLKAGEGMTRAEVAEAIYRLKMIQEKNLVTYSK